MVSRSRILLVDDRPENLLTLETVLAPLGQPMIRASSGEEALKALLTDDVAVILLDVQMPGMDGFETAAHIKRRERTRDIPVIFLTAGNHGPHHTFRGYAAGAVDYLSKRVDPWVLRAKVQVFLHLYAANQCLQEQSQLLQAWMEGAPSPGSGRVEQAAGMLPELALRLAAAEDQIAKLTQQIADPKGLVMATRLEHELAGLRRLLAAFHATAAAE